MKNSVEFKPQLGHKNNLCESTIKEQVRYKLSYLCSSNDIQESLDFLYED
jgi:hypothetical protein